MPGAAAAPAGHRANDGEDAECPGGRQRDQCRKLVAPAEFERVRGEQQRDRGGEAQQAGGGQVALCVSGGSSPGSVPDVPAGVRTIVTAGIRTIVTTGGAPAGTPALPPSPARAARASSGPGV
jgi:hypothetical protein